MNDVDMIAKFGTLWPEVALLVGAVACLATGLSPKQEVRNATVWVAAAALVVAGALVPITGVPETPLGTGGLSVFVKLAVVAVGLVLLMVAAGVPLQLRQNRQAEGRRAFEPGDVVRGEFFAFFLFSLTGVMLVAGGDDLVWLFLALELVSLPTYVMVATSRDRLSAQESAVKYFFLGALSVAVFLYGFALLYGATGHTTLAGIQQVAQDQLATGSLSPLLLAGLVLSILGISFKIAAVPMHFYAADVYQGSNVAVTAFLAFVPKTAGFIAIILLLSTVGWPLPPVLMGLLWAMAVLTMTTGNVLALLQNNVKRVLAYSSVAHSGYALVGVLVGPALAPDAGALADGIAAVLFYLVAYGFGSTAAFGVLGCLQARGDEAETFDDIAGMWQRHPGLAGIFIISAISLLGLPPLVGFLGKVYLVGAAFTGGFILLSIILVLNSAVSAAYYLRMASVAFFGAPSDQVEPLHLPGRFAGVAVAGVLAVALGFGGTFLAEPARDASLPNIQQQQMLNERPDQDPDPEERAALRDD